MNGKTRPVALEAEVTPIGVQTLVIGVAPISPAQRLAMIFAKLNRPGIVGGPNS
jgi:hypothetical protein